MVEVSAEYPRLAKGVIVLCAAACGLAAMLCGCSTPPDPNDPDYRRVVVARIGESRDLGRFNEVVSYLKEDKDELVRAQAAVALGMMGDKVAVPFLAEALDNDTSAVVRWDSCEAIRKLAPDVALTNLKKSVLKDGRWEVRRSAALALGEAGDVSSVDEGVMLACIESLAKLTGKQFGMDVKAWRDWFKAGGK
jgi:hypothetical protein